MPRLEFMDAAAQSRLIGLASDAIELARDHEISPTDALTKVAEINSLNPDEINRVKEAINTAAVLALRKRAAAGDGAPDDIVPLVDGDAVLNSVFKTAPAPGTAALSKVAAEITAESMDFTVPQRVAVTKVAAAPVPEQLSRDQLLRRADVAVGRLKVAAEIRADSAFSYRIAAERKITALVDDLCRTDASAFSEIEKTAMALYPGEGLDVVCNLVYAAGNLSNIGHTRFTGELPKYASAADHVDIIAKLRAIRDDIGHSLVEKLASDEIYARAARGGVALLKAANDKGGSKALDDGDLFSTFGAVSNPALSTAVELGGSAMNAAKGLSESFEQPGAGLGPTHRPASVNERLKVELGSDRTRLVFNKVMNADPVISKYPRNDVVQAFNELTALQPSLSTQPLALRSALRRYLVSGGDFTMQEASQIKNFNRQQPDPGTISPAILSERS